MKKKGIIIGVIVAVVIIIAIVIGILFVRKGKTTDESLNQLITLDINPSIEIEIHNGNADRINMLNEEANEVINRDFEGKPISEVFDEIIKNVREKGYFDNDGLFIILGVEELEGESNKDRKTAEDLLREACERADFHPTIMVPQITEEAKHEAQGYGITPAKAAVILDAMKRIDGLNFDDLKDKSVRELNEMKEHGVYCEQNFQLHGNICERVVSEEKAEEGQSCPEGTNEYKGKCYKDVAIEETDNLKCRDGWILKDSKCVRTISVNATPDKYTCSSGTAKTKAELGLTPANAGDAQEIICVDESTITHPITPCEAGKAGDGTEYLESGGKCYWHRAPAMDGQCPGKEKVGYECWDDATGIYICLGKRDGERYKNRNAICPGYKSTNPTVSSYKCDAGYTLDGNKCNKEESEAAEHERTCRDGYTLIDNSRCLNLNEEVDKVIGLVCPKEARLEKDKCVFYETSEVKNS